MIKGGRGGENQDKRGVEAMAEMFVYNHLFTPHVLEREDILCVSAVETH